MISRCLPQILVVTAVSLAGCKTVDQPAADGTPPIVKLDIYNPRGFGYPNDSPAEIADCCTFRRTIAKTDPLTLVASAEDADSGVTSIEIVATVLRQCMVTRSFPGNGRGVPDGPPVGRTVVGETERVLATATANASPLPQTRLANAITSLADLELPPCPPVKFAVNDDPPTTVTIAEQSTTFCGVRFFTRATNGANGTKSTAKVLLLEGPPQSGAFPCPSVPF